MAAGGLWLAPQASAVSGPLRLLGEQKELDVLPPRTTGRTRWPAIDTRGRDAEYEFAVIGGIAGGYGVPAPVCLWAIRRVTGRLTLQFLGHIRIGRRDGHCTRDVSCEYGIAYHSKGSL